MNGSNGHLSTGTFQLNQFKLLTHFCAHFFIFLTSFAFISTCFVFFTLTIHFACFCMVAQHSLVDKQTIFIEMILLVKLNLNN